MIGDIIPIEMLEMKLRKPFWKNGLAYFNLFNTDKIEELPLIQFGGSKLFGPVQNYDYFFFCAFCVFVFCSCDLSLCIL